VRNGRRLTLTRRQNASADPSSFSTVTKWPRKWLKLLGPGLITGASDDDPSGVATYAQAGAQFGSGLLWTLLLTLPLMIGIQEVCARVGRVTGLGLAGNIRRAYSRWVVYGLVGLLSLANVVNIGADLGAMGAAATLIARFIPPTAFVVAFALFSLVLMILLGYERYARVLMWLSLSLTAYVAAAFVVKPSWPKLLESTFIPKFTNSSEYFLMIVAVFGTTISPYLFFWQASQEAEDVLVTHHARPLLVAPTQARWQLRRLRVDTLVGMAVSNLIGWFIMVTSAATLNSGGLVQIDSAATAAAALRPLAGEFAELIFALGIVGTGLLAVPVLAGSAAYAVGEVLQLPVGINRKPKRARVFYAIIVLATILGLVINFMTFNPMRALIIAAVVNGVAAVPIMVMTMFVARNPEIMGQFVIPKRLLFLGWLATAVMAVSAIAMFATLGR
jgi:NRAMP (natural resistance-associated macrophage protein)-like metal ion transporter